MKKELLKLLTFVAVVMMAVSCGSSKKAMEAQNEKLLEAYNNQQRTQPNGVVETELAISECEIMSQDMSGGTLRAYGTATDADRDFARQIAVANAKGQMTNDMTSLVKNVLRNYRAKIGVAENARSQANVEQEIETISENMISNTTILKSAIYGRSDGTYRYEVCIGSIDMPQDLIEKLAREDEELKTKYNQQLFRESYQDGLNQFRQQKANMQ